MNRPETLKLNNIVDRAHLHLVSERVTIRNAFPLFLRVLAQSGKKDGVSWAGYPVFLPLWASILRNNRKVFVALARSETKYRSTHPAILCGWRASDQFMLGSRRKKKFLARTIFTKSWKKTCLNQSDHDVLSRRHASHATFRYFIKT